MSKRLLVVAGSKEPFAMATAERIPALPASLIPYLEKSKRYA